MIGYKAYPEDNIEHMVNYTKLFYANKRSLQFAVKRFEEI